MSLFPLEPRTARESEILARADLLPGRSLGELSDAPVTGEPSSAANKGAAGAVIERWFGITERLLGDAGIVRHRGKIEAAINTAGAVLDVQDRFGSLAALVWAFQPRLVGDGPCPPASATSPRARPSRRRCRRS